MSRLETLTHHLDALDVVRVVEDLAAVDDRVRDLTRSDPTSPSGELMEIGATSSPPAALRMSRRSVTVLSTSPVFIALWLRPM